jgi:Flp pilus assembly pilin Flp
MFSFIRNFINADDGTTAIEYGLIVLVVFLVIVASVNLLSQNVINTLYNNIAMIL